MIHIFELCITTFTHKIVKKISSTDRTNTCLHIFKFSSRDRQADRWKTGGARCKHNPGFRDVTHLKKVKIFVKYYYKITTVTVASIIDSLTLSRQAKSNECLRKLRYGSLNLRKIIHYHTCT